MVLCGPGRSPCGERGLKYSKPEEPAAEGVSLPVRGAWIEMLSVVVLMLGRMCRSPCGERGLKYAQRHQAHPSAWRRSPCGERGLKYPPLCYHFSRRKSLPVRGAWIEIVRSCRALYPRQSLPVRGAWIEMRSGFSAPRFQSRSLPVRGAWIEIPGMRVLPCFGGVAPRAGSVD